MSWIPGSSPRMTEGGEQPWNPPEIMINEMDLSAGRQVPGSSP
ncbi:MAG: hypothetical protein ACD_3C00049G0017, partial [uncultured bacterium (gcode 4)]